MNLNIYFKENIITLTPGVVNAIFEFVLRDYKPDSNIEPFDFELGENENAYITYKWPFMDNTDDENPFDSFKDIYGNEFYENPDFFEELNLDLHDLNKFFNETSWKLVITVDCELTLNEYDSKSIKYRLVCTEPETETVKVNNSLDDIDITDMLSADLKKYVDDEDIYWIVDTLSHEYMDLNGHKIHFK